TWHEYFMAIAEVASTRSNCIKRRVGAIIVKDKQIVSTGYNGTPKGIKNCDEGGCPRCWDFSQSGHSLDECLCVHAEENAIVQAACNGISIQGSTVYSTFCPCSYCAKSIINAGIKSVVYRDQYALDEVTTRLFREAGIELIALEKKPFQGLERRRGGKRS
ncbi:MAG: dCMP deaminase family protein, partial [Candidatus Sumerlaeota bacterium]|nr:dCMP deaminase family protein [Candidatus Sumerlaeota bacterium]